MRTLLFILVILIIIAGALGLKFGVPIGSLSKGNIAPYNEWATILKSTKWEFNYSEEERYNGVKHNGKIKFYDSTYEIHVTVNIKQGTYGRNICGGVVRGNYYLNQGVLSFRSSECDIKDQYTQDHPEICKFYNTFGIYSGEGNDYELTVLSFNKEKIIVEGKGYRNGSDVKFSFLKLEE